MIEGETELQLQSGSKEERVQQQQHENQQGYNLKVCLWNMDDIAVLRRPCLIRPLVNLNIIWCFYSGQ